MLRFSALFVMLAALVLTACGGGASGSPSGGSSGGDPAKGKIVFESSVCITCHTLSGATGANGTTGPSLNGIGTRAATRKPNTTAEAYIRESETTPNAFVVEGFPRDTCRPGREPRPISTISSPTFSNKSKRNMTLASK